MSHSFKVAARTLRHLGGELITSDEMALNELTLYTTNFTEPLSYQGSAFLKLPKFP